jgi:PHP family Zn ribbon phosphoesterase
MITDNMIDDLGIINQQIADLEAKARKIKQVLIAKGVGKYTGMDFFAEVQHYDRATINPILVREFGDEDFVSRVTQVKPVDAVVVKRVQP